MEKNVIVIDKSGVQIGSTFPKRAKGLVKNGRAEYIDDRTIRLVTAHVPTVIQNTQITEDKNMSKVINFRARDFRFDKSYQAASGSRLIETVFERNIELFVVPLFRVVAEIVLEE